MDFFRYDSDLMQAIGRAADLAWLNILCVLCSIPVFTFGASITAKYYVAMKLERGEAPYVTKEFFKAFKDNFRQDLKVSIILILIYTFFGADWYIVHKSNNIPVVFIGMLAIFSIMILMITFCIFPMIARFEMKTFDAFRNALIFGVVHLPRVVLGIAMEIAPFIIAIWYFKWAWLIWLFIVCMALYYNSRFFIKHFDRLEERVFGPKKSEDDEEDEDGEAAEDSEESPEEVAEDSEDLEETEEAEEAEGAEESSEDTEDSEDETEEEEEPQEDSDDAESADEIDEE